MDICLSSFILFQSKGAKENMIMRPKLSFAPTTPYKQKPYKSQLVNPKTSHAQFPLVKN